ncbi:20077_t:CDS:2, partial [Entrophospora sp. SA101]
MWTKIRVTPLNKCQTRHNIVYTTQYLTLLSDKASNFNLVSNDFTFMNIVEVMEPLIMGENKNTDELSSIWRKRFINALKITTNNAETDQTARQIATLLINQKQSSTITKFWKQLKIDKTYESAQERLQNKKSIFKVNSQIDAPDILEVFRTYQTIQVT